MAGMARAVEHVEPVPIWAEEVHPLAPPPTPDWASLPATDLSSLEEAVKVETERGFILRRAKALFKKAATDAKDVSFWSEHYESAKASMEGKYPEEPDHDGEMVRTVPKKDWDYVQTLEMCLAHAKKMAVQ